MKNFFLAASLCGCGLAFMTPSFAQDTVAPKVEAIGMAAIEEGQFVKGDYTFETNGTSYAPFVREVMPYRAWLNNEYAQFGVKATLNSHFSAVICPQIKLWNDTWDWKSMGQNGSALNPFIQHLTVSIADAEGIFRFGRNDGFGFTAEAGVFPFKYDQDAKNLGEYLFRTGEHPAFIQNSFDYAYATLTGIRLNTEMLNRLSLDVLLTQETQIIPINDWSLSILAAYKVPEVLDIGAGIMFDRLIPVAPSLAEGPVTTLTQDTFYTGSGTLDTLRWGGTKVMARVSFDPKGLLPRSASTIFGNEDLKIYSEASILGLKSFTAYKQDGSIDTTMNFYSDIKQRIPRMIGFNIPTCSPLLKSLIGFGILDYLSVEAEYYPWPYSPSLYNYESLLYTVPQPIIPVTQSYKPILYTTVDDWKWSVNFKKTIFGSLSLIGQIARDHTRHDVYYSAFADPEEVFIEPGEWGWWFKVQYNL